MTNFFQKYPKSDRRAIIILACIATFCFGILLVVDHLESKKVEKGSPKSELTTHVEGQKVSLSTFDPNTVDSLTLTNFGIKSWKIKNFMKYRRAGAIFRTPESILRTYGWEESDYKVLEPYIVIGKEYQIAQTKRTNNYIKDDAANRTRKKASEYTEHVSKADSPYQRKYIAAKFKTLTKVDPNTADTTLLCSIPGIGKKISEAIIRYRGKLGGYTDIKQIAEIKIVSPELLEWFEISNNPDINKININKDSFQRINSHPYISYDQTRDIMQYRRLYGDIKDIAHLASIGVFTEDETERLKPYIIF
ncbi:MAG: helix-hairpin-helix domain-containing protein [Bacteroidaceae bacterium]|nr:helix-hairpin-helix domain-containing protein [Bacteroidaceae bacterium]